MNTLTDLIPLAMGSSVLLAGAIGWGGHALMARYREDKAIEAELEAEKVRRQRLENEFYLARHRVQNLQRALAKARHQKKRQRDLIAARNRAVAERDAARNARWPALHGEAA